MAQSSATTVSDKMADTTESDVSVCFICKDRLTSPRLLPCLHVFCEHCLSHHRHLSQSATCPMCNFQTEPDQRCLPDRECNFLQGYLKVSEPDVDRDETSDSSPEEQADHDSTDSADRHESPSSSEEDIRERSDSIMSRTDESQIECPSHPGETANEFCPSCNRIVCNRCVSTRHRRCKNPVSLQEAVETNMLAFNTIHEQLTKVFLATQTKVQTDRDEMSSLDEQKQRAIESVKKLREELVNTVLQKEQDIVKDVNARFDVESKKVTMTLTQGEALMSCVQRSLDVFECAMSMNGHGELLEVERGMSDRVDQYSLACDQLSEGDPVRRVTFTGNDSAVSRLQRTLVLGEVITSDRNKPIPTSPTVPLISPWEGKLTLISSFHGGTREDATEPLLTDVIILHGGEVILTDRDNKCLKKFNSNGKVLTRVPIPDIPSRVAVISNSKIAVTVMNKKLLLYFSIFGTLRILAQVRTKKQYAYITGTQDGRLLVGTNNCDTIDLIDQTGAFVRNLYTQKAEKAVISRPLYLTQTSTGDFLVSDSGRKLLFALEQDGVTRFSYKPKEHPLECPLGVACDVANHALLADRDGNSIHLVSPKGVLVKHILTEDDALVKPCGVYVCGRNIMALTQVDGYVKVYRAEDDF